MYIVISVYTVKCFTMFIQSEIYIYVFWFFGFLVLRKLYLNSFLRKIGNFICRVQGLIGKPCSKMGMPLDGVQNSWGNMAQPSIPIQHCFLRAYKYLFL